ncbi:hypothetical protein NQ318_011577 [Aromia moschata]|uniref:Uncharacterized protein n=1 Tax=Aromia moschata TaxID=1265417 RepID=A0AAV8Z6T2_9CUCU|nr:hypothetical protein NQ318_011577 [Aromia moschata]
MSHVRKVPRKRQAVVDDDTKLNLLLALEENPITPARQLARDRMYEKRKSFFSARTIGNVMAGMLLWHATSSLVGSLFGGSSYKRPVNVYNYYNQPAEAKQEMKLPSNILTLCEGSNTALCTSGTTAICTTNNTVLCVTTMTKATPCAEENNALCINTTIPCTDPENPLCKNMTSQQKEAPVNLPCFTNLTVDVNLLNEPDGQNKDHKYCVTTMAVAGPEYKDCTAEDRGSDFRSVLEVASEAYFNRYPERRQPNMSIFGRLKENLVEYGGFNKPRPKKLSYSRC